MNILFIEDDLGMNELGTNQLRSLGHEVYATFKLAEAVDILNDDSIWIDLIIADHRLPDGRGVEFLVHLIDSECTIPSVVVSGCLTKSDVTALEKAGIPYFRKPVLYSTIIAKMRRPPPIGRR
jgi:DNA-binding response OmpR family regulator